MKTTAAFILFAASFFTGTARAEDDPIRPDLQFKGSTGGEGKASMALAFWFYEPTPAQPEASWRPAASTLVLEAVAETKDGIGQLLSGKSGDGPTFQAPVSWSLGVSLGKMHSHSAEDLFGENAVYRPSASTLQSMDQAIRLCKDTCSVGGAGCDRFKTFSEGFVAASIFNWAERNLAVPPLAVEALQDYLGHLIPAPGPQCVEARNGLANPVQAHVTASASSSHAALGDLAKAFAGAVDTCSNECQQSSTLECQRVAQTKQLLKQPVEDGAALVQRPSIDALQLELKRLLPGSARQCAAEQAGLGQLAQSYLTASDNMASTAYTSLVNGLVKAIDKCNAECADATTAECQRVTATKRSLNAAQELSAERAFPDPKADLCDAAKPIYFGESRDVEAARYPRSKIAVGGSLGFTPHKYLDQRKGDDGQGLVVSVLDDAGMPTGETLPQLEEVAKTYGRWKAGISGAYLPLPARGRTIGTTFEWRLIYEGVADGTSKKAEWCTVRGVVGDLPTSPQADACLTLPKEAPERTHKIAVDGYLGFADLGKGLFRVALGPEYTFSRAGGDNGVSTHTIGAVLPFSLNLLATPRNEQKLDYDGLVRLTSFYRATFEGDEKAVHSVGVVLELLGKRTLFSTKYDEL